MGGKLGKPGFYNSAPNLTDLDKGDLKFEVDFRSVYATILDDWLGTDAPVILNGKFENLKMF